MSDSEKKTIPGIAELRVICQSAKRGDRRWWYVIYRRISIYITWALLHTPITANQVSAICLLFILAGCVLTAMQSSRLALVGYALLMGYHLLDKVDGEIARFRKVFSIRGVYMDELGHTWIFAGIFLCATIRIAPTSPWPMAVWILGFVASVTMVLIRMSKKAPFFLFSQHMKDLTKLLGGESAVQSILDRQSVHADRREQKGESSASPARKLSVFLRNQIMVWSQFLVALWLFIAATIVELITGNREMFVWILIIEGIFQTLVYAALVVINLKSNVVNECLRLRDEAPESLRVGREEDEA